MLVKWLCAQRMMNIIIERYEGFAWNMVSIQKKYKELCHVAMSLRGQSNIRQTQLIIESLEDICNVMERKNIDVKLGLENRVNYHEMPNAEEYDMIFNGLPDAPVYMWHDIGHGEILNKLGLFDGIDVLSKYKNKLLGVHIHDVNNRFVDHLAPYMVSNVLDYYLETIKSAPIKVLELSKDNTPDMIIKGVKVLDSKLNQILV